LPYVERYVSVAQEDLDGFSTNPVVFFRFSQPYDFGTVDCKDAGLCSIRIVDITKASPEYDTKASLEWKTTKGPLSNYICPHWLALRRPAGSPLRPNTTYAAILTNDIRPEAGGSYARGKDFAAMLASSQPSDDALKSAWDAYAPLRAWIADKGMNESSILNAAVFTTQDPEAVLPKLRQQLQADAVPAVSDLTRCESENTQSPCEDSAGRGKCHAASSELVEIHGHISLPIFQQGTPPYKLVEDGGGFTLDSSGAPAIQNHTDVCFAMSVPAAAPPASGYPVLVFAHGTGGSFADEMGGSGFAQTVATGSVPAVLVAIDMPEHGARRGSSTDSPEDLFYNFLNPRAARDNVLQGAADLMSVVRWVSQGGLTAAQSPTSKAVPFDPNRIALMGHSQGATHSSVMVSHEPNVIGVVLSGNGGHLTSSLLHKSSPVDIASVLPLGLLDPDSSFKLAGAGYNPALSILQMVFDRADPVNYARRLLIEPSSDVPTGQHVFMTEGIGDTYSPNETAAAYLLAGHITLAEPVLSRVGVSSAPAPLSENESVGATPRTIGARQYMPKNGVDGHFVAVDPGQDGRPDVERFLDRLLAGKSPAIGQ
jgi:pimeloyl-ACP methyl ester carboxylesterase